MSHIFPLQLALIVTKYNEIHDHRFVDNARAEQYVLFTIDVVQ